MTMTTTSHFNVLLVLDVLFILFSFILYFIKAIESILNKNFLFFVKTLDTIGYCQRPVFSLSVPQHSTKLKKTWKFELNWSRDNSGRKKKRHPYHTKLCAFSCSILRPQKSHAEVSKSKFKHFIGKLPFLTMFYTINSFPLRVTSLYANNYFE